MLLTALFRIAQTTLLSWSRLIIKLWHLILFISRRNWLTYIIWQLGWAAENEAVGKNTAPQGYPLHYSTYITFLKWYNNRNQQHISGCQRLQRQCGEWEEGKWVWLQSISTCAHENVWCLHCKCSSCDTVLHFLKCYLPLGGLSKGYKRFLFSFFLLSYNRSWPQPLLPLLLHVPHPHPLLLFVIVLIMECQSTIICK